MSYFGLALPPEAAAFVTDGGCDLPLATLHGAEALEPGRPVRLIRPSGELLGLAVGDPENGLLRVMAHAAEGFDRIGPALFDLRVERALALRQALGLTGDDAAYRILHGAGDSVPGFTADVYGPWAVLHAYARALLPHGREIAEALVARLALQGVVVKVRSRGGAGQGRIPQAIVGTEPPERLSVRESDVPFEVHLRRGLNVGLFTDMREQRHALARLCAGRSVLNGFSYTGTLSVIAARAGAASVTSVDLSSGAHNWARDNFRLSGLVPEEPKYRFESDDVGRFLARAADEKRRYDLVLLDPPTWSAARGAPFALDRDYPELIARACALLPAGGLLWLACNARESSLPALAQQGLRQARRQGHVLETGGLPPDHPTLPIQPLDRYLQVVLLRVA